MSNPILDELLKTIEVPEAAYEKAGTRYKDIGDWLGRPESECESMAPHVYVQGSYNLGCAIKPINEADSFDLDLVCSLEEGVSPSTYSQSDLKSLLGREVNKYRKARNIDSPVETKHRCLRLTYADNIAFHMDIVPAIPWDADHKLQLHESLLKSHMEASLASEVQKYAIAITDDQLPSFNVVPSEWPISNPEGYAHWFKSRMRTALQLFSERADLLKAGTIDEPPVYKWKTPLQQAVQLLKRHRDIMFKDDQDLKPISVIITTLAAQAYKGEGTLGDALTTILRDMDSFIRPYFPRIPNPVNPNEDFADKWVTNPALENNLLNWLVNAKAAFRVILTQTDRDLLVEKSMKNFGVHLKPAPDGFTLRLDNAVKPVHIIKREEVAKPWCGT